MTQWEYSVKHAGFHLETWLNELGNDGWELAGVLTELNDRPSYIFKRPLSRSNVASTEESK